eukprot:3243319-Amphidinium_carterae.1
MGYQQGSSLEDSAAHSFRSAKGSRHREVSYNDPVQNVLWCADYLCCLFYLQGLKPTWQQSVEQRGCIVFACTMRSKHVI